jgi:hypothetical protein
MESNQQTLKTQELTILAFINGPLRAICSDELSKLNIGPEYSTIFHNRIVEKLINNTEIITDFTENKKEFIIDIKKYIKLTKKQTSKVSELVNIAKKPAATTTPKHDESSEEFDDAKLKKLKVTELKEIYSKKCGTVVPKDFKKQDIIDAILTQNDNAKYEEDNDEDDEDDDEDEEV